MNVAPRRRPWLASPVVLCAVLFGMILMWIVASPPTSGADEPGHQVRAAALARGKWTPLPASFGVAARAFELPAYIGFPDPGCYAFQPAVPASCAADLEAPDGDALLTTRSSSYPVWGHLPAAVGTLGPSSAVAYTTRVADAFLPALLVAGSLLLVTRRGWLPTAALVLATTPAVWFIISVVNPSGLVIAGALSLWVALLFGLGPAPPIPTERLRAIDTRLAPWMAVAGWAAMVLPRRDGMVWACVVLAIAIVVLDIDVRRLVTWVGRWGLVVVACSTVTTWYWAAGSDATSSRALFATPLAIVAAVVARAAWRHVRQRSVVVRSAVVGGALVVAGGACLAVMTQRTGGFDRGALRVAIIQTGIDLEEAIGILGWLDTPIPRVGFMLWFIALGTLVAVALVRNDRLGLGAAGFTVGAALVLSWTLTMLQDSAPTYWQGRYYLPLLVGVPLLLVHRVPPLSKHGRAVGPAVILVALAILNLALAAAMRRWGVGVGGSLFPTDWHTYGAPIPPVLVLVVHAVLSVALFLSLSDRIDVSPNRPGRAGGVNVVGYHHAASGLGSVARELTEHLRRSGVEAIAVDVPATASPQLRAAVAPSRDDELFDTTIAVVTAPQLETALSQLPAARDATSHLVGYFFYELDTVPDDHAHGISLVDEIWTPTTFVADAYRGAISSSGGDGPPVELRPLPIPQPVVDDALVTSWRRRFAPNDEFLIVTSLDLLSVIERKNPVGAIEAFRRAFPDDDQRRARLVVKTINGNRRSDDLERLIAASQDDARISIVDEFVQADELDALIAAADVFVSLHRSEGLGLHLATAMWVGTPVIATAWSGNLDFMDTDSAALVSADLVPVVGGGEAYPDDARWADPDLDEAADWMRRLALDPSVGGQLATAARQRIGDWPTSRLI